MDGKVLNLVASAAMAGAICGFWVTWMVNGHTKPDLTEIRREIRKEMAEEHRAHFKTWERDHLADAVKAGYGEWFISPAGINEFRWKPKPKAPEKTQEKAVRSHEEAVGIISNKRSGQWLALTNGTIINLETGETE